jgi:hypothetical protein
LVRLGFPALGMEEQGKTRRMRAAVLLAAGAVASVAAGCGGSDFQNKPRPPVPVQLTGVIEGSKVTVSPSHVGAGPLLIIVSNQTQDAHTITLQGGSVRERVGPVNPLDTATIQKTLNPGTYQVSAGSAAAVPRPIRPAELVVGRARPNSSNQVELP